VRVECELERRGTSIAAQVYLFSVDIASSVCAIHRWQFVRFAQSVSGLRMASQNSLHEVVPVWSTSIFFRRDDAMPYWLRRPVQRILFVHVSLTQPLGQHVKQGQAHTTLMLGPSK